VRSGGADGGGRARRFWAAFRQALKRYPAWAVSMVALGALIVLVSGGGYILLEAGLNQISDSVKQDHLLPQGAAVNGNNIDGPLNLLLVGVDKQPTDGSGQHSDTIIILHIPATHDRAYLISIPRDTSVDIPAFPKTNFGGGSYKVNAAFTFGSMNGGTASDGFQLLASTLNRTWGLTFNAGAIVNFDGFEGIVKKLGGVTMYVDETVYSIHRGTNIATGKPEDPYNIDPNTGVPICSNPRVTFDSDPDACTIPGVKEFVYTKGTHHFDPASALDFVRARDGLVGTDYGRQRHQVQFIKAIIAEAYKQGLSDPTKLYGFITSIASAFTFDGNGTGIPDWIFTLKGIQPNGIVSIKTNGGQIVPYVGPPVPDDRQMLNDTSIQMLNAVKNDNGTSDTVGQFISQHTDWIAA
jgi:LCP family protein required for cell wall assembly